MACLNIHASLLPRWRGAAPIHRAIMAGDAETGVCIMQMDQGLDTGDILRREALAIEPVDTSASLSQRLAELGARLLPKLGGGEAAVVDVLSGTQGLLLFVASGGDGSDGDLGMLAQGEQLLGDRTGRFGFGKRRGDTLMLDEAANHVGQHRIAM